MKELLRRTFFYSIYKKLISIIATILNGNPSKDMFIIGITGTNGKTTTANLIHKILNDNLGKTALISTTSIKIGTKQQFNDSKMTSLNPFKLQKTLNTAKIEGCKYVVLEVSSHGIDQHRFGGIEFNMGILTNITPEHLDYHKTMEEYSNVKFKLFQGIIRNSKSEKLAVLPKDDKYGRKRLEEMAFNKVLNFGILTNASISATNIKESINQTDFTINYLGKTYNGTTKLLGEYNIYNILAAISACNLLGLKIDKSIKSIKSFELISGRMENVKHNGINYFIDFAHTPDALDKAINYLNNIKGNGKLITIFGATGNRDKFKRPIMGEIVDTKSDIMIITDDDPDTENRYEIISQILKGVKRELGNELFVMAERELAIKLAVNIAKKGDIVLIAGKGHEKVQLTNNGKRKRNDKEELIKILKYNKQGENK